MSVFLLQKIDPSEDYETRLRKVLGYSAMPSSNQKKIISKPLYSEDGFIRIGSSEISLDEMVLRPQIAKEIGAVVEEYKNRDYLKRYNLPITNKILFYGPSGCGKTLLATALSRTLGKPLFIINLSRIVNSGLGQTSTNISQAIEEAMSIEAIIFFDEFDALAKERSHENDHGEMKRVTSSLLQMMDHIPESVVFIAATNHLDLLDRAILRRFNKRIEFFKPNKEEIKFYIGLLSQKSGLKIDPQINAGIAALCKGESFATIRDKFLDALKKYLLARKNKKMVSIDRGILEVFSKN